MKKRCILCGLVCSILVCLFSSCDGVAFLKEIKLDGTPVVKEVALPYDAEKGLELSVELNIANGDAMQLTVLPPKEGEEPHAVITYPKDFEDYGFSSEYAWGRLSFSAENKYRFQCEVFDVVLYADLRKCELSGAVDIDFLCGEAEMSTLSLTVNGAAACDIEDIRCDTLKIVCNGAAAFSAEGTAETFLLTLNGAGDAEATELLANTCEVTINGAGNAEVCAKTTLKAQVNGVGSVSYLGDPKVEKSIGGIGTVNQIQDTDE